MNNYPIMPGETGAINQEYEWGNVKRYGVVGDGSGADESTFMKNAINSWNKVYVPIDIDVYAKELEIPSDKYIVIDGKITLYENPANLVDGIAIFKNLDQTNANSNITICGNGQLNAAPGNVTDWTGVEITQVIRFVGGLDKSKQCKNIKFSVRNVSGNIFTEPSDVSETKLGGIQFTNCANVTVDNVNIQDWGREGINLDNCYDSIVSNIHAIGNTNIPTKSWSAVQVDGEFNKIENIYVENAGASSVGIDSKYSIVNNIHSTNNRHQHGVNFGHSGFPASGTVASNITVINAGTIGGPSGLNCVQPESPEDPPARCYHGINIGNGTEDFSLSNVYIKNTFTHGINISSGASNIRISNIKIDQAGVHGIKVYRSEIWSNNINISNCNGNGVQIDHSGHNYMFNNSTVNDSGGIGFAIGLAKGFQGDAELKFTNCDFSVGNQGGAFGKDSTIKYSLLNTKLGNDDSFGGFSIASMNPGVLARIYNSNVRERSRIIIENSNAQAAAAEVYLRTRKDGFFEIGVGKSPAGGAHIRYHIC